MRALGPVASVGVFCVLTFACVESPTSIDSPQFNFNNAPEFSGIVMRGEFPAGFTWVDAKSGMRVLLGLPTADFCAGNIDFDLVTFQALSVPDGRPILRLVKGSDMRTEVFDFLSFDCALFTTNDPVASGLADLVNTDNDLLGAGGDGNANANAWGFRAHGRLTRPDGSAASFSAHLNLKFSDTAGGFRANSKITVK